MDSVLVYHNPDCAQSRRVTEILAERDVRFESVLYLETPPSRKDLARIIDILSDDAAALVRKDKRFNELGLNEADFRLPAQVVALLDIHPELMQRPVVIRRNRAILARPAELVLALLDDH